ALTQGLLSALVADAAPPELRGTAFGVFNLASGVAMLVAAAGTGFVWDRFGAPAAFYAGAAASVTGLLWLAFSRGTSEAD
ncbi:MAG: MFS transporter, partial [Elusimicrobia bacterium]|nr:MFS transporter [Elusimicrobiota bacterium]